MTGKAVVLLQLRGYGPLEIRINDLLTVLQILRAGFVEHTFTVRGYSKATEERLTKLFTR